MSEEIKIYLPKLGESILSAVVVQWFKKEGDFVRRDEPLLEVSTDKINSEIPSPEEGILKQIVALADQEVEVGGILGILSSSSQKEAPLTSAPPIDNALPVSEDQSSVFSPSVARLLMEKGISLKEVEKIPRTGEGGRLTRKDVENYLEKAKGSSPCPASLGVKRVPMTPMRKAIAENMVRSFYQAPHASLVIEVDMSHVVHLLQQHKSLFLEKHGVKLTLTAFVAQAMARAVQAFPLINASLEEETIVMKQFVNLGIAVSVDQGVMVPVIRQCEQLSLVEIARKIAGFAEKARTHQLSLEETQGGSITMTNFGMTGVLMGVPIIRYPEVAIVGLGAMSQKVVPTQEGAIVIRPMMMISLTFDHRVLDGLYGCGFLGELKRLLEEGVFPESFF